MKPEIHPETTACTINCVCGATYQTITTQSEMRVDVCAKCHPFYTGQQTRFIDTAGRVESFRRRYGLTDESEEE